MAHIMAKSGKDISLLPLQVPIHSQASPTISSRSISIPLKAQQNHSILLSYTPTLTIRIGKIFISQTYQQLRQASILPLGRATTFKLIISIMVVLAAARSMSTILQFNSKLPTLTRSISWS